MRKELDDKLCANYPEIFRDRHKSMRETAMCWGFECGDGWYSLIDTICCLLTWEVAQLKQDIAHLQEKLTVQDKSNWTKWMNEYSCAYP